MSKNQYDAQADQYSFQADQARKHAARITKETGSQLTIFGEQAQQTLGRGVYALARAGNLGWDKQKRLATGVDLGKTAGEDFQAIQDEIDALTEYKKLKNRKDETIMRPWKSLFEGDVFSSADEKRMEEIEQQYDVDRDIGALQDELARLKEVAGDETGTPELTDAALATTGSDLLAMSRTRDILERTRRRYLRDVQHTVYDLHENAEQYDQQAASAEAAANIERMNQVFGTLLGGAQTIYGFTTANPKAVFSGFSTMSRSVF